MSFSLRVVDAPTCYSCSALLGVNDVLVSSSIGVHFAFNTEDACVWIVCRACGQWNLPDMSIAASVLHECDWRFARNQQPDIVEGVGQVRIGKLRLTKLGLARPESRLSERQAKVVQARNVRIARMGAMQAIVSLVGISGAMSTIGPPYGAYIGAAVCFVLFGTIAWIQRQRRLRILDYPEQLDAVRGDAASAQLVGAGAQWSLKFETSSGIHVLSGSRALTALARLLPLFPPVSTPIAVREATAILHHPEGVDAAICAMIHPSRDSGADAYGSGSPHVHRSLRSLSSPERLALEMIAAEHYERGMLARSVSVLNEQYTEAMTIAKIIELELPGT